MVGFGLLDRSKADGESGERLKITLLFSFFDRKIFVGGVAWETTEGMVLCTVFLIYLKYWNVIMSLDNDL